MKKKLITTLAALILSLTMFAGGVFADELYTIWKGSADFQQTLENLNLISERGQELKTERDGYYRENEQLVNRLKDKDNLINAKEQEIDSLRKENQQLRESSTNNSNELKQAEKDMKEVNQKSKDVLNSLK